MLVAQLGRSLLPQCRGYHSQLPLCCELRGAVGARWGVRLRLSVCCWVGVGEEGVWVLPAARKLLQAPPGGLRTGS